MYMYNTVTQLLNNPRTVTYLNEQYLREIYKFKDHDIKFIKLFWQPDFDETWIILDELFIKTWLIQDTSLNMSQLQQFLFAMFHKDVDYKLSDSSSDSLYMVKGLCLKHLCLIYNKFFRYFFIKLGRVAHMLVLNKCNDDKSLQINLNKATRQHDILSHKVDNLTFLVKEIMNERVEEIAKNIILDSKCEEVVNLIKLPQPFKSSPHTPAHLRNAGYIVIRCLRKNYDKHLNTIKSYGTNGCEVMMDEVFTSPVANKGLDIVNALKTYGIKTHKSNGVSSDNHIELVDKVRTILENVS